MSYTFQMLIQPQKDILIAGICIANNCKTIITKNKKHFERIDELDVETY